MAYSKERWKQRTTNGLCGRCGKSAIDDKTECVDCRDRRRTSQKSDNYKAKKKYHKDRRESFKRLGLCSRCGLNKPKKNKLTCESCLNKQQNKCEEIKDKVFQEYGGYVCNCCGETIKEFLTLDHIENDGSSHRKEISSVGRGGRNFYLWIIKNNFPNTLQVLCMNCNWGKRVNGTCPHKWMSHIARERNGKRICFSSGHA